MPTVLVIEDNDDLRTVLVTLLRRFGCDARGAPSARAGLSELLVRDVDLVITDWKLGDGTGGALLDAAAAAGVLVGVGVIIYSSSIEAAAPAALADTVVVPKSCGVKTLLACVSRLVPGTLVPAEFGAPAHFRRVNSMV
jgi:DNA-binding NtrC family response regulator